MITFTRKLDGTYLQEGSLPPRSSVQISIPDRDGRGEPAPVYKLEYALNLLQRGPLRYSVYKIVAVDGPGKASDGTEDRLAEAHRNRTEARRQRREARENGTAPVEGHVSPDGPPAPTDSPEVEVQIQPEGATRMVKQTREEQAERAKKIREQFAEGATVAQLVARFQLANAGVVGNILTGRSNPKAGGPIVRSTRRPKEAAKS